MAYSSKFTESVLGSGTSSTKNTSSYSSDFTKTVLDPEYRKKKEQERAKKEAERLAKEQEEKAKKENKEKAKQTAMSNFTKGGTKSYYDEVAPLPKTANNTYIEDKNKSVDDVKKEVENKTTKSSSKDKRTWFNTKAFKDGYQFGDITKSVDNTIRDARQDIAKGILGIGEGVVDLGAYAVGGTAKLFGNDDLADSTSKFISKKLVEDSKVANIVTNVSSAGDLGAILGASVKDKTYLKGVKDRILGDEFEESSLLGEKSDSLVQSGGQLLGTMGLQAVGVPWWLTTGATSFGKGTEEAFDNNASYGEAGTYGLISAGAEVLTEKLSGGISFGGKTLDDYMLKPLTDKIANKTVKTLTKLGIDALGEGGEEVLTEVIQNVGKKLTYEDEKTWNELLTSEDAMEGYLEAFIGGSVMGGGFNVGRAANSIKTGRDYDTGLTTNEQKVIDKEVESRKQEAIKEGKTLSNKEITKIEEKVKEELSKGYISTDSIESTLGGDTYNQLKSVRDKKASIETEIDTLENKPFAELTVKEKERLDSLREELKGIDTNTLENQLQSEMGTKIASDDYLQRSYQEKANKGVKFDADLTKYDAKQQETIKKAIDSGILNNTNKTHEFVDMVAKISADKGVSFDFANNQKLKDSGFAIEGKSVNGFVNENGITVNIDSSKALNRVVGHEITHVLEGTDLYTELQQVVKDYATTKGEYDTRLKELTDLYKDVDKANIENELTADLVGDYLFTDTDFVNNLSTTKPNVFKKIYNEIKYLLKVATAGSKEARELEKVKKTFEEAYRNSSQSSKDTKYHISETFSNEIDQVLNNTYDSSNQVKARDYTPKILVDNGVNDLPMLITANHIKSTILTESEAQAKKLYRKNTNYHGLGKDVLIKAIDNMDSPLGIYKKSDNNYIIITEIKNADGNNIIVPIKIDGKGTYNDVYIDENQITSVYGKKNLENYIKNNNFEKIYTKKGTTLNERVQYPDISSSVENNIAQNEENVKYSLNEAPKQDNQGRTLTKEQQEYFKDSKVRDEKGNLLTVYHGTPDNNFFVFDNNKIGKGAELRGLTSKGFYFTDSKVTAEEYASIKGENEKQGVKETYLNIKNPLIVDMTTKDGLQQIKNVFGIKGNKKVTFNNARNYINKMLYDDAYNLKSEEQRQEYFNSTGYDGVIFKSNDGNEYIVFNSNQIKNIDNTNPTSDEDIRMSLGNKDIATSRNDTFGSDIKLQVEEAIAPLKEEITKLQESLQTTTQLDETNLTTEADSNTENNEFRALTEEDLPMLEQQYGEDFRNIDESNIPIETQNEYYNPSDAITIDNRALNTLTKNLKNELGLQRGQLTSLEKIIQDYSMKEDATKVDLYNALKSEFSEKNYKVKNEYISEAKQNIRNMKIKVSDSIKSDIADYFKFMQSNFGKIKFSKDGLGVDTVYEELNSMYPDLFPRDIATPSDQLLRISEVANTDTISIEEYVLPDSTIEEVTDFVSESIQAYKNDAKLKQATESSRIPIDESLIPAEDIAPIENTAEVKETIAPVSEENTQTEENKNLTIKETNEIKLKNLEKSLNKYRLDAKNSYDSFGDLIAEKNKQYDALKNKDTLKANNILQQVTRLNAQRENVQADYERKINNVQKRIEKMNSKEFKTAEQRQTVQQQYREQAREIIGDTSTWKDKKMGIQYQINTMKRNLRDIVKGIDGKTDLNTADAIYNEYFRTYDQHQAQVNREANAYKKKYEDLKINAAEHEYIQMLGEFKYNPETTLTEDRVKDFLNKHKSKIDEAKVNTAIEYAKKDYDELFNRINETLRKQGIKELEYRKGYFPHFTEEKQGFLGKLFDWKTVNDEIPTDIAGLTELNNPEKSWQGFNKHRKGDTTTYNFGKGFDTYLNGALDWIHHIEDIQKVRALENEIRFQHSEKGVQEQIEAIYNDETLDADEVQERIDSILNNAANPLNNFVTDLRNWTNNVAGKKSTMDRSMEYATNRKIYSTMTNISNRVSGNMVGGSISSALTNFIPITQSWGTVSPVSSLKALKDVVRNSIKDDGFINKSTFLTNRLKASENLYKSNWDKANDKVGILFDGIDSIVAQTIVRSKYAENIKNGMTEYQAMLNADQFAKDVIGGRSKGDMPTIFNSKNPMTKLFTAFQLEVNNQYGHMFKDMPTEIGSESKAKLVKGYATMFLGASLYNALYSSLAGRDVAFDPIGLLKDILETLRDDDEEPEEKFTEISESLLQQVPFVGGLFGGGRLPISGAIPYDNPIEMFKGTATDSLKAMGGDEKALKDLTDEWLKPVTYVALPFGGGQIKKTIEGLSMFDEDLPVKGSYTNSGALRFPVEDTPLNRIQAGVFGRWANDNAQQYIEEGRSPLKEKQIQEYKDLDIPIADYWKYRDGLKEQDTIQEKFDYINGLDVTDEQKNIMINNAVKRKTEISINNYDDFGSYEEFDYATKNPEKYSAITQIDTFDNYNSYKDDITSIREQFSKDNGYSTEERKAAVQEYINSLNLGVPQKIMLQKMAGGYSIKDYESYMYSYIESLPMTATEKQAIHNQLFK